MAVVRSYEEFNNFQNDFYLKVNEFNEYTNFDFKRHGYTLLNNIAKGFPNLVGLIINLKGINWSAPESPAIIKALQRTKFINNFNSPRIPSFIYFKTEKEEKSKEKIKSTDKGFLFDMDIQTQICSVLFIDSKTYEYLKFSPKIQFLGQQLNGEFVQTEKAKTTRKKKV